MIVYENGKVDCKTPFSQKHKNIFHSDNALRPSCHNCKYANLKRCSDITIADFWGIEKSMPDFDDNKGVSLILVNTSKGSEIFNEISVDLDYKKSNINDCIQASLICPTKIPPKRKDFWEDYNKKGYSYIIKIYADCGFKNKVKSVIIKVLRKTNTINIIKNILKR